MNCTPVSLFDYQEPHYQQLQKILTRSHCAIDSSATGSGKSYTAMKLAQHWGYQVIVISTKTAISMWKPLMTQYGLEGEVYSYGVIRGSKDRLPCHPLLHRSDSKSSPTYLPTAYYQELVDRGVFLIVDEVQNVK